MLLIVSYIPIFHIIGFWPRRSNLSWRSNIGGVLEGGLLPFFLEDITSRPLEESLRSIKVQVALLWLVVHRVLISI
jgi:hypothetical protein